MVRLDDGVELWTAVSGTGPPAVLLHGGPGLWDYLGPLAALLEDGFTVIRFDQRGCGRSGTYQGPFAIAQAIDDLDRVRAAIGHDQWMLAGHSWGAELAIRYAAAHPDRSAAVAYLSGIGAGDGYRARFRAERERRLGTGRGRVTELDGIPAGDRTLEQERELRVLEWTADFSPGPAAAGHARALWDTRPEGAAVNMIAHRELWADRDTEDLCLAAARVACPVTMICGADDPRPWTATDSLLAALPNATRTVLDHAGHALWAERPAGTRRLLMRALRER